MTSEVARPEFIEDDKYRFLVAAKAAQASVQPGNELQQAAMADVWVVATKSTVELVRKERATATDAEPSAE